jgi:hypothetical protein
MSLRGAQRRSNLAMDHVIARSETTKQSRPVAQQCRFFVLRYYNGGELARI